MTSSSTKEYYVALEAYTTRNEKTRNARTNGHLSFFPSHTSHTVISFEIKPFLLWLSPIETFPEIAGEEKASTLGGEEPCQANEELTLTPGVTSKSLEKVLQENGLKG